MYANIEILVTQCVPILTYSCGSCCINVESKSLISVCFKTSIRRIFGYYDFASV